MNYVRNETKRNFSLATSLMEQENFIEFSVLQIFETSLPKNERDNQIM